MSLAVETVGAGPHLTLLHGWGLNAAIWGSVQQQLAQHFTLHLVDLPGHGASGGVSEKTLAAMADRVATILPAKTHLLGWSLGGQIALQLAAHHQTKIDRLVLVATTPKFVASDDWQDGVKAGVLADFATRLLSNYNATIRNFLALQALHQDNLRDTIVMLQKTVLAHGAPNVENLMHGLKTLAESDLRPTLAAINHPALVIQGDHDALTREPAARWLAAQLPNSTYHLIPHAAHAPFLSHQQEFLTAVQSFLLP